MKVTPILPNVQAAVNFSFDESVENLREEREKRALGALRVLWLQKGLIVAVVVLVNLAAFSWLLVAKPQYTSVAIIEFSFGGRPTAAGGSQPQGVDANSVVESASQVMRSRGVAAAVTDSLKLERDRAFAHESRLARLFGQLQVALRISTRLLVTPPSELATNEVMRRVMVVHEPHTYLVTISATGETSEQAADIANTVAAQYLRMERRLALENERSESEQQVKGLVTTLGEGHPSVVRAKAQLEAVEAEFQVLQGPALPSDKEAFVPGRLLHRATPVDLPSSPNIKYVLQAACGLGVFAGIVLALFRRSRDWM